VRGETFAFLKLGFIGLGTAFAEQRGDFRLMLAKPCKQFRRRRGGYRQPYLAIGQGKFDASGAGASSTRA
jgi:hypothetical protein